jgi:hypothetical protein
MKLRTTLLFLIITNFAFSQGNSGVIKVRKKSSNLLCLNGYTDGAIPPFALCGGKGLYVEGNDRYKVTSFVVLVETSREVEERINGSVVSGEICETIATTQTGDAIYISKITAIDNSTGNSVNLPPLRFQIRSSLNDDKKKRYDQMNNH